MWTPENSRFVQDVNLIGFYITQKTKFSIKGFFSKCDHCGFGHSYFKEVEVVQIIHFLLPIGSIWLSSQKGDFGNKFPN